MSNSVLLDGGSMEMPGLFHIIIIIIIMFVYWRLSNATKHREATHEVIGPHEYFKFSEEKVGLGMKNVFKKV